MPLGEQCEEVSTSNISLRESNGRIGHSSSVPRVSIIAGSRLDVNFESANF